MKTSQVIVLAALAAVTAACAPKAKSIPLEEDPLFHTNEPLNKDSAAACGPAYQPIPLEAEGRKRVSFADLPAGSRLTYTHARLFFRIQDTRNDRYIAADLAENAGANLYTHCAVRSGAANAEDGLTALFPVSVADGQAFARRFTVRTDGNQLLMEARNESAGATSVESLIHSAGWDQVRLYETESHGYELRLSQKVAVPGTGMVERYISVLYGYQPPTVLPEPTSDDLTPSL